MRLPVQRSGRYVLVGVHGEKAFAQAAVSEIFVRTRPLRGFLTWLPLVYTTSSSEEQSARSGEWNADFLEDTTTPAVNDGYAWWMTDLLEGKDVVSIETWGNAGAAADHINGFSVITSHAPLRNKDLGRLLKGAQEEQNHAPVLPSRFVLSLGWLMTLGGGVALGALAFKGKDARSTFLLSCLILAGLGMTFYKGIDLGMLNTYQIRYPYTIPTAISRLYYGLTGYTRYCDVYDFLEREGYSDESLGAATNIPIDRQRICYGYFASDDLGGADFVVLSFALFGAKLASMYSMWFLVYALSILVFILRFHQERQALLVLLFVVLSVYVYVYVCRWDVQVNNIYEGRVFGVLSLAAYLHLVLATWQKKSENNLADFLGLAFQAGVILFGIHVRSSVVWQAGGVVLSAAAALLLRRIIKRGSAKQTPGAQKRSGFAFSSMVMLLPALLLIFGLVGLNIYNSFSYDPWYRENGGNGHIFWHNVGIGLWLHPRLSEEFSLHGQDDDMQNMVNQYRAANGKAPIINRKDDPLAYDADARQVVLGIFRSRPRQALELFLYYKPLQFYRQTLLAAGITPDHQMDRRTLLEQFYNVMRWDVLAMLALALLTMVFTKQDGQGMGKYVVLLFSTFVFSLTPALAAYALFWTMAEPLVCLAALFYSILFWGTYTVLLKSANRLGRISSRLGYG